MFHVSAHGEEGVLDALSRGLPDIVNGMAELWETAPGAGRSRQRVHSHRKAPRFMLDLFDALADSNGGSRYADMREGNVVRSFRDKGA